MPRRDHPALTLALANSIDSGPKKDKKGKEKEKEKDKRPKAKSWRPGSSGSVSGFSTRSGATTSVRSLDIEERTMSDRRSSGSGASTLTAMTASTVSAGSGGLLTPVASSSSSHSGSSGGSGEALIRDELREYHAPEFSSRAWADYVNAIDADVKPRTSAHRPSSSSSLLPSSRPLSPTSRIKIPPMPKSPPPPLPAPASPLPSPPNTAPLLNFRTPVYPSQPLSSSIPIPKRPSTSPAASGSSYQQGYPSSPEEMQEILRQNHRIYRTSRSPPRPRSRSRSRPRSSPSSPGSPGPPPNVALPPLPTKNPRRGSVSTLSPMSPIELPFITPPSASASSNVPHQVESTSASTAKPSLNPPTVMMENSSESDTTPLPNSSLLLTTANSPPNTEMKASANSGCPHDQKPMNKKPSPALLALWERQSRGLFSDSRVPSSPRIYPSNHSPQPPPQQQEQPQGSGAVFTSTLKESPKSGALELGTSPPKLLTSPVSPVRHSNQLHPGGHLSPPSKTTKLSPRAFIPTPLPPQVDEETASLLSLERRGELINIAVEAGSDSEDERREIERRLSSLSFLSNASEDHRLSGLISSFPVTPTSTALSHVTPFLNRPVRRAPAKGSEDSADADDEGWDSDVDPHMTSRLPWARTRR